MTTIELSEFRITNRQSGRLVFTLGVERDIQVGMLLGEKGRNLELLRTRI